MLHTGRIRRCAPMVGSVLAGALLFGCDATPRPTLEVRTEDIAAEVFRADDVSLIEYATNRLRADCMAQRGYPQLQQAGVRRYPAPFDDLQVVKPAFATVTEEASRSHGFGEDRAGEAAHVVSFDRGFDSAFEACGTRVEDRLGKGLGATRSRVYKLHNDIADDLDATLATGPERAETEQATSAFLDCIDAAGFHAAGTGDRDLDAYGVGIATGAFEGDGPPAPKRVPGTVEILPATPARRYVPPPRESSLAVAANRCARATGFGDAVAEQRRRLLGNVLVRHEAEIIELRADIDRLARSAARAVGR